MRAYIVAFLGNAILQIVIFLTLLAFLKWLCKKRPKWKNACSFFVGLGAAYAVSFLLDMLIRVAIGELQMANVALPLGAWFVIANQCHYLASRTASSDTPLYTAYLLLGLIASFTSRVHAYNLFVGLPLVLFASLLFIGGKDAETKIRRPNSFSTN